MYFSAEVPRVVLGRGPLLVPLGVVRRFEEQVAQGLNALTDAASLGASRASSPWLNGRNASRPLALLVHGRHQLHRKRPRLRSRSRRRNDIYYLVGPTSSCEGGSSRLLKNRAAISPTSRVQRKTALTQRAIAVMRYAHPYIARVSLLIHRASLSCLLRTPLSATC